MTKPASKLPSPGLSARGAAALAMVAAVTVGVVGANGGVASKGAGGAARTAALGSAPTRNAVVAVRRTTESQYRHAIADVFGPDIVVNAKFEPEVRLDGLLAVGSSSGSVSASGFQQYFSAARSVAAQVLDEKRRDKVLDCQPADATKPDEACAERFVRRVGPLLFRRPLTDEEVRLRVKIASRPVGKGRDFHGGLQLALIDLLTSPEFVFRVERAQTNVRTGEVRLDPYARASRISYLLWDAPPDAELLAAAGSGELMTTPGVEAQVNRMAASPRVRDGLRAFFDDMLQFDGFDALTKDAAEYPKFSQTVALSAREQTLRTLVDHVAVKNADYRTVFTTRETFINRPLAAIYKVPFASNQEWAPYTFAEDSGRAGVLTQAAFLSLFSHPGRSSPTKRGAAISEIFLCQTVPQPPADVDLSALNDDGKHGAKTVRERLEAHRTQPLCAACHGLTDPPGLALEQFDGVGQRRLTENGAPINVAVEYRAQSFSGAHGLGQALHENPEVPACLVRRMFEYGHGRAVNGQEMAFLDEQTGAFAASGYRVRALLARLAASPAFLSSPPPEPPPSQKQAALRMTW